jgi:hypothetical protein
MWKKSDVHMFYKICFFSLFCCSLFAAESVYLKTPSIAREDIIGTNVGIRPFRQSGIRLEAEIIQNKLIIHNYGYGASGLTIAFGGAAEAIDILEKHPISSKVVAVLGGGVVGLATTYDLLEKGYEVHLYSDKWSPNLVSNVAEGCWTPPYLPKETSFEKREQAQRMLTVSEHRLLNSLGSDPEFAGVRLLTCYVFHEKAQCAQEEEVLVHFDNGLIKQARKIDRLALDGKLFMDDLFSKVKTKGALLQEKRFVHLEDVLNLEEDVIINCMSMGSREVFNDSDFVPVRGQLVYFKYQEGCDHSLGQSFSNSNYFFHLFPWSDRLILGGVYEIGEEEATITSDVIERIIQNAEKFFELKI